MQRSPYTTWFLAGVCAAVLGCVTTGGPRQPGGAAPPVPAPPGEVVRLTLTPDDVQRLAVERSALGAALVRASCPPDGGECLKCLCGGSSGELTRTLRAYAADEVRNQSAGLALEGYYRLAEARGQLAIAARARKLGNDLVRQAEELRDKGLKTPDDYPALLRQRSEQTSKGLEFALARDKLSEQLGRLAAPGCGVKIEVQTIETFHVRADAPDENQAVAVGLKYRADLNLLRTAACRLDAETLPVIRHVLTSAHGLLGDPRRRCLPFLECVVSLIPAAARPEVEKARRQLHVLAQDRERSAASDIRSAVREVKTRHELVVLAREREGLARKQVAEQEGREAGGFSVAAELGRARAELLKAEGLALHEVIEWELARVRLRQAQGLLVREVLEGRAATGVSPPGCR